MAAPEPARLFVDRDGLLVGGDARLLDLNARAGGAVGAPLAIPQLATIARLVASLELPIARRVLVGSHDGDLELQVHARHADAGVEVTVTAWEPRGSRPSWLAIMPDPIPSPAALAWRWVSDARLNLTEVVFSPGDPGSAAEFVGQRLTRLVRLIEDDDGDLPILSALAIGAAFVAQRGVRRDLPDAETVLSATPVRDADGAFAGYRGRAEPPAPLIEPAAADSRFVERLGQALRGPLDRIVSRADSIATQADGPLRRDYADYAGDIANAGRYLLALVDDLADLEAVERADFAIVGEAIDLVDLTRRAAGLLSVRAADRGVRIDRPDADDVLPATGDFRRVLQILVNLIGNAVRYSPPGAMVWLRTEREGDTAVVIVADQGKGIDIADHRRIFEKFVRVDTTEAGGSGLGLYISQRLARAMGGDITVDSAPGQGARFVLTLPV